jgi:hypothetical protein
METVIQALEKMGRATYREVADVWISSLLKR